MLDTIMFDLDGTLLQFSQEAFLKVYLPEIEKVFEGLGYDPKLSIKAVWDGTAAMVKNDGKALNTQRFWETFANTMQLSPDMIRQAEAACDSFYSNEFDIINSIVKPTDIPERIVHGMIKKGYFVVLATNPLFPLCAVTTRLGWINLKPEDFILVTHYANSSFCKPNQDYYLEIMNKIKKTPEQCLMIGNNPVEDMAAGKLGSKTYLVTDFIENDSNVDISVFNRGTLVELEGYLASIPDIIPVAK